MVPFGAGILLDAGVRCKRLTVCAKGAPDRAVTAVHIGLAQRASRAELCAFCECRRTAPGLLCCCCALRPALRCRSCARCPSRWAIALRRHVRSCSPRVLHHTHPVDLACFVQVSMSAIQRGAVVVWHAVLPLENSVVHKIFSRGCAPHPLSLETRFSLYHIKVLHLLANRLTNAALISCCGSPRRAAPRPCAGWRRAAGR